MRKFNIENALQQRKIVFFSDGPKLISKELSAAQEDLQAAKNSFATEQFKWATEVLFVFS